jgi:hypothetical protein
MKALFLYVLFVVIGVLISVGIGYYVEREVSSTASLIVFLLLFFSNFVVSWIAVILAMDGSLEDAQGRQAQLDIEKSGRAGIALREANAITARAAKHSHRPGSHRIELELKRPPSGSNGHRGHVTIAPSAAAGAAGPEAL